MMVTANSYACTLLLVIVLDKKVGSIGNSGRVFTVHSTVPFLKVVARHLIECQVDIVIVPNCEDRTQLAAEILKLTSREGIAEILPFSSVATGSNCHHKGSDYVEAILLGVQFIEEWNHAHFSNYSVDLARELLLAHDEVCLNCVDYGTMRAALSGGEFSDRGSVALEFLAGFEDWCRHRNVDWFFANCQENIASFVEKLESSSKKVAVVGTAYNRLFTRFLRLLMGKLKDAQVILPFVDLKLAPNKWKSLDSSHCQHYLMKLLFALEVDRADVRVIGDFHRNSLVNLLFNYELAGPHFASGLGIGSQSNVELITCDAEGDESRKIVEILQLHASENESGALGADVVKQGLLEFRSGNGSAKGKLALNNGISCEGALDAPCVLFIGSDSLASRVRSELLVSNAKLPTGDSCYIAHSLIVCVLEVISSGGEASKLLAVLKHPLVSLESQGDNYEAFISEFELSVIRESAASGFEMISKVVALNDGAFVRFWQEVISVFSPLLQLKGPCTLEKISQEHFNCLSNLMCGKRCSEGLFRDAERKIYNFFALLKSCCKRTELFYISNYRSLIAVAAEHFFHNRGNDITSAFFASGSVIVVSGFNEGEFTKLTRSFLLNDEVRSRIGLPTTEEYCGYFSYIMYGILHAKKVYITRSEESCGQVKEAPLMVRYLDFLLSLFNHEGKVAVAKEQHEEHCVGITKHTEADVPNPTLEIRQRVFSALTAESVDVLLNNPFAFYARYILGMRFVRRIDVSSVAKNFSSTVRRILSQYLEQVGLANDYCALMDIAKKEFAAVSEHYPYVQDLWWPRFEEMSRGFFRIDSRRKQNVEKMTIGDTFTWNVGQNIRVTSKCDRVEYGADRSVTVVCHKIGTIPSQIDMRCGLASRGVIDSISVAEESPDASDISFEYWKIAPEDVEAMSVEGFASMLENARAGIGGFLRAYSEEMIPFYPRADFSRFAEYELFSRIGEHEINLTMRR
ncbi:ATP-dependent helicase/nuclease subunit B [Anaplasma platys]|uniref:ATP-dependent helicase/nuclease subunit B n=1 Tax=Anaplasma platys TaxID=949 RepID=A0A858PYK4_9RICK|nr:ATP-dependent helicase/nuclease subunit B [Anaplasma platys]